MGSIPGYLREPAMTALTAHYGGLLVHGKVFSLYSSVR